MEILDPGDGEEPVRLREPAADAGRHDGRHQQENHGAPGRIVAEIAARPEAGDISEIGEDRARWLHET